MRYYQFTSSGDRYVGVETADGQITDLTSIEPRLKRTNDIFNAAVITDSSADEVTTGVLERGGGRVVSSEGSSCDGTCMPLSLNVGSGQTA